MSVKHSVVLAAFPALLLAPGASAEKLSKESKKWLEEEVAPIIVPSEEKTYKDLKESDRLEFQKIFWARRDPSNDTPKPENDFKAEYLKKKAEADQKFKVPGRAGSVSDCGRTYILLGEPDQKQQGARGEATLGARSPETWTYKDKPSLPIRIKSGVLQMEFDEQCQFAEGRSLRDQLTRIAEGRITRPGLEYRAGKDGRLIKLLDQLPKPSQAQLLLKEPRQDFPGGAEVQFLKTSDGGTALVGMVYGKADGLTAVDIGGKNGVKVTIAAQAIDESGRLGTNYEQATVAPVAADGTFSASYRLGLKPGKYAVRVAALDEASKKGTVIERSIEVPDLNTGELSAASLIAVREIEENIEKSDPAHPFSAYLLGAARLVPYSGRPLSRSEALNVFYQYYDAALKDAPAVTLAEFTRLETGMSHEQVVQIVGFPGEQQAASGTSVVTYGWKNPDGSNMSATFVKGALDTKAQAGLTNGKASVVASLQISRRDPQCLVSMEDFNRISTGMSYDDVATVIGLLGEKRSETTLASLVGEIHQWKNGDASSLLASFQNGRLVNKTQTNLPSGCKGKGDRPVARAADNPFDLQVGGNVVGPVPLEKYEPGIYTVKLKVVDNVAKKEVTRELSFEVK